MTDARGPVAPRLVVAFRLAVAMTLWLATVLLHRRVSYAVGEPWPTPWGSVTPIDHTTTAMVLGVVGVVAVLARRARGAPARVPTVALWGALLAIAVGCHGTLVTIDIEVIHYPQYALVAVLLAAALDADRQRRWLLEVVLISALLSVIDEAWQYFHSMKPAQYFDFNDLVLNQIGTLAGLLWYYGFPRGGRVEATRRRRLLAAMLALVALCAAICGWLAATGILIVTPVSAIQEDGIWQVSDGLRVVLQYAPGIFDNWRPSRSGGTYFVLGPGLWLAFMAATTLVVWAVERRLRDGTGKRVAKDGETDGGAMKAMAIMRRFAGVLRRRMGGDGDEIIAILGGTGDLGTGLAMRWAKAGHRIVIGSRTLEKAQRAVAELERANPPVDPSQYAALENPAAAAAGDIVVLTVPAAHQLSTLESVRGGLVGKILIDVTVPLVPPRVGTVRLPEEGSAGKRAQDFLGSEVRVVTAFQNIAAHLLKEDVTVECDVLVCGNKRAARQRVIDLAAKAGLTAWHAGPIENSAAAEALTSVLIQINRRHEIAHSGIKIVGQTH